MAEHRRSQPARLLVLGAGAAQLGLLQAAAARDVTVIAVDRDPLAVGFALADERAVISSEDEQGIDRLARARAVDGLISPGADWPVGIAARVAERLGLPHPIDGATAVLSTTKTRQRERFASAGVLQPRTFSVGDPAIPFPCVVKAPDRQGQRGLTLVDTSSAFAAAVGAAVAESRGGGVLVEELIDGPELTVNAVSRDGAFIPLTVTDRLLAEPPAFGVALAHVWPSCHPTDSVIEAARAAVAALGIDNGPSYTQIRLGPRWPAVRRRGRGASRRRPRRRALPRGRRRRSQRSRRLVRSRPRSLSQSVTSWGPGLRRGVRPLSRRARGGPPRDGGRRGRRSQGGSRMGANLPEPRVALRAVAPRCRPRRRDSRHG